MPLSEEAERDPGPVLASPDASPETAAAPRPSSAPPPRAASFRAPAPSFVSSPDVPFVAPDRADAAGVGVVETAGGGANGAAADEARAAGTTRVAFRCTGETLSARLEIDAGERPVASALDLALLAADAEAAIAGLERWFGVDLDVVPPDLLPGGGVAPLPANTTSSLHIGLAPRAPGSLAAALQVPLAALASLPPLSRAIELSLRVSVEPLATRLRLARLALPRAQLEHLRAGAVVLLPASFGPGPWPVRLEVDRSGIEAVFDAATSRLLIGNAAFPKETDEHADRSAEADATARIDIVPARSPVLDPRTLLGGGSLAVELPAPLPECVVHCLIDGVPTLSGHLAPLGDGYAFFALGTSGATGVPNPIGTA